MIKAGRLNDYVTLLELANAKEASGQRVKTYAPSTTISPNQQWCNVRQMRGAERVQSLSLVSASEYVVTFRYLEALTSAYQIKLENGNVLEIDDVTHDENKSETVCYCKRAT